MMHVCQSLEKCLECGIGKAVVARPPVAFVYVLQLPILFGLFQVLLARPEGIRDYICMITVQVLRVGPRSGGQVSRKTHRR